MSHYPYYAHPKNLKNAILCTYWDKDGQKEREEYYDNGLKEEGSYKGGKVVLLTKWYDNGQKKSEENYKDGYLEGKSTTWYDNGQKKSEGSYKVDLDSHQFLGGNGMSSSNSERDGKWTEWYEDGKEKPEEDCLDNDFLEECDENDKPTVHRFSEFDDDIPF